jgi:hypothetical protein
MLADQMGTVGIQLYELWWHRVASGSLLDGLDVQDFVTDKNSYSC